MWRRCAIEQDAANMRGDVGWSLLHQAVIYHSPYYLCSDSSLVEVDRYLLSLILPPLLLDESIGARDAIHDCRQVLGFHLLVLREEVPEYLEHSHGAIWRITGGHRQFHSFFVTSSLLLS